MVTIKVVGFTGPRWKKLTYSEPKLMLHLIHDRCEVALCRKPSAGVVIVPWWIVSSYVSFRFKTQKRLHIQFLRLMLAFYPRAHPRVPFLLFVFCRFWVNATKGQYGYVLASLNGHTVNFALSLNTTGPDTVAKFIYLNNEVCQTLTSNIFPFCETRHVALCRVIHPW